MISIKEVEIENIKSYKRNAKKHDKKQIQAIANSIELFGFRQPIVLDKNNEIVVGHGRYLAAVQLGLKTVPCEYADDLTDEQIKAYRLADNKLNESEWIDTISELELSEIQGIDMSSLGFLIDKDNEEEKAKENREKMFKSMELKAFEHYDYLVFVFKNQMDFLNAAQLFGIEKVDAGYGNTKKIGIGRVIDGARLFEKI